MSAKCRRCGKHKPAANSVLCLSCHSETQGKAAKDDGQIKCGCGRTALTGLEVCDICWRQQDREIPDAPIYGGLATQDPAGRWTCPGPGQEPGEVCGGSVKPVNTFTGENYYRCERCGAVGQQPPMMFEPHLELSPEAAIRKITERTEKTLKDRRRKRLREAQLPSNGTDDWSE